MKINDYIQQRRMIHELKSSYGEGTILQRGKYGSVYMPSNAPGVPEWKVQGTTDFDKFIKRYNLSATDKATAEIVQYTMASRGSVEASKNVTMIIPTFKDIFGRKWVILQEEARPIDIARNGIDARQLAFPAGIIGDEAAFKSETATASAVRELIEETGLLPKKIVNLLPKTISGGKSTTIPIMTSPGLTDESTYFFKAIIDTIKPAQKAKTDGGVTRGWHFVPLKHIMKWFDEMSKIGKTPSGQTLSAIALLLKK